LGSLVLVFLRLEPGFRGLGAAFVGCWSGLCLGGRPRDFAGLGVDDWRGLDWDDFPRPLLADWDEEGGAVTDIPAALADDFETGEL